MPSSAGCVRLNRTHRALPRKPTPDRSVHHLGRVMLHEMADRRFARIVALVVGTQRVEVRSTERLHLPRPRDGVLALPLSDCCVGATFVAMFRDRVVQEERLTRPAWTRSPN